MDAFCSFLFREGEPTSFEEHRDDRQQLPRDHVVRARRLLQRSLLSGEDNVHAVLLDAVLLLTREGRVPLQQDRLQQGRRLHGRFHQRGRLDNAKEQIYCVRIIFDPQQRRFGRLSLRARDQPLSRNTSTHDRLLSKNKVYRGDKDQADCFLKALLRGVHG